MSKVAFLALTYKDFAKSNMMKNFFHPKYCDLFSLYIHSKAPIHDGYNEGLFNIFRIRNIVDTQWGHHNLVHATINLLETALINKRNSHFVLISDTHAPLYNMEEMTNIIKKKYNILSFTEFTDHENKNNIDVRFKNALISKNKIFRRSRAKKVYQWFVCTRSDAEFFVDAFYKYEKYFVNSKKTYTDEFYFQLMAETFNVPWQNIESCFVEWDKRTCQKLVDSGVREWPYTFSDVSKSDIDAMRASGHIFFRKIHKTTRLPEKYIFKTSRYRKLYK
jgi:hypothetical protein